MAEMKSLTGFCKGKKNGGKKVTVRYQASDVPGEKIRCLDALAKFQKPYLIQKALRLSLDRV